MDLSFDLISELKLELAYAMLTVPLKFPIPPWHKKLADHVKNELPKFHNRSQEMKWPRKHIAHRFNTGSHRKKALVTHGWMGSSAYMSFIIEALVKEDYEVVSLDIPCHGQSPGYLLKWQDAVNAILNAQDVFGPFDLALGHSYGGAMTLGATGANMVDSSIPGRLQVDKMVLIAAPTSLKSGIELTMNRLGIPPRYSERLTHRLSRLPSEKIDKLDGVYIQENHPTNTQFLCLHAKQDKVVPYKCSTRFAQANERVELVSFDHSDHISIVYQDETLQALRKFVSETTISFDQHKYSMAL